MAVVMIKSVLISAISERLAKGRASLSVAEVKRATEVILEGMTQAMLKKQRIEIRGFGVFTLHYRRSRTGRNPKTGQSVQTPAKYSLHFKPGKNLKACINHS